jgi:hypothetical protein
MEISNSEIYDFVSCSGDLSALSAELIRITKKGSLTQSDINKLSKLSGDVLYSAWSICDEVLEEKLIKKQIDRRVKQNS